MSSVAGPWGFRPADHPSGVIRPTAYYDGILSGYTSSIFQGDAVLMATTGVLQVAPVNVDILGVFAGVQYVPTQGARAVYSPYWLANQTYVAGTLQAFVYDDPTGVFEVQANGPVAQAGIGDQADLVAGAGNTTTGISTMALNSALVGSGNQGQFRIVNLARYPDNAWGDAFTVVQVKIARHQYVASKVAI